MVSMTKHLVMLRFTEVGAPYADEDSNTCQITSQRLNISCQRAIQHIFCCFRRDRPSYAAEGFPFIVAVLLFLLFLHSHSIKFRHPMSNAPPSSLQGSQKYGKPYHIGFNVK